MTMMPRNRFSLWAMIARAPEGEGGAGGDGGAGDAAGDKAATPTPESVLFPDEGKAKESDAGDDKGEGEKKPDASAGKDDWKEYENDPAKSEAENAAAKAEHDKTKPAEKPKDDPLDTVPENGEYKLTMPDGVELDSELLNALAPKLKGKGYTTREAQELADEFIKVQQTRAEAYAKTPEGAATMQAAAFYKEHGDPLAWIDKAKGDKEIGGDRWDATVADARKAVTKLGSDGFKSFLEGTGGGNHPEVIRFMAKVGGMIKEDNPAGGGAGGSGKPADAAHILFPNDAPKG